MVSWISAGSDGRDLSTITNAGSTLMITDQDRSLIQSCFRYSHYSAYDWRQLPDDPRHQ